jgi:hypothetical protein
MAEKQALERGGSEHTLPADETRSGIVKIVIDC